LPMCPVIHFCRRSRWTTRSLCPAADEQRQRSAQEYAAGVAPEAPPRCTPDKRCLASNIFALSRQSIIGFKRSSCFTRQHRIKCSALLGALTPAQSKCNGILVRLKYCPPPPRPAETAGLLASRRPAAATTSTCRRPRALGAVPMVPPRETLHCCRLKHIAKWHVGEDCSGASCACSSHAGSSCPLCQSFWDTCWAPFSTHVPAGHNLCRPATSATTCSTPARMPRAGRRRRRRL
jgi:hypothetical protein